MHVSAGKPVVGCEAGRQRERVAMTAPAGSAPVRAMATVRGMRRKDVGAVAAIERLAYPRPWPEATFSRELGHLDRAYLVARQRRGRLGWRSEVVGYAGVLVAAAEAHVLTVAVRPDARGRGVGAQLVLRVLEEAQDRGAAAATLEVRPSNHPARSLYRRFGFVEVGRRPRYYSDAGEDAVIMWCYDLQDAEVSGRLRAEAARLGAAAGAGGRRSVGTSSGGSRTVWSRPRSRRRRHAGPGHRDVV